MFQLKYQNLNPLLFRSISFTELGASEQLKEWDMRFLHIKNATLFLVNYWFEQNMTYRWQLREEENVPASIKSKIRAGVPTPRLILYVC